MIFSRRKKGDIPLKTLFRIRKCIRTESVISVTENIIKSLNTKTSIISLDSKKIETLSLIS